jgi:O-antigen/teichoic acid export membrane protein
VKYHPILWAQLYLIGIIFLKGFQMKSNFIVKSLLWKLLERFGVQGCQFLIQIILARLLQPEHYGILALMIIFTSLANVFIQSGFNTALVQNKDVKDEDYSSVFWISLIIAIILYLILFVSSPTIARFYNIPGIVYPLRVLSLVLFPGVLNSIQIAKVSREMNFKQVFLSNLVAIIISGIVGIILAYNGFGVWTLVAQMLTNTAVACIVMSITSEWKLSMACNFKRVKVLFSFGWKLLIASLLDTLYQDLRNLVIGKKYNSETLAYYSRGQQFPQFLSNTTNSAIQSVMLSAMSKEQENQSNVKNLMRNSIMMSAFLMFPLMAGLAGTARPIVALLLTEKWLPCVPFMQIYCFTYAFYPVHTCNLQAINAIGRSDMFLKLELIKKGYGIIVLAIAVICFDSPIAIAATGLFTTWLGWFVNAYPNRKLISYSFTEQFRDIFPPLSMSLIMFVMIFLFGRIHMNLVYTLILQIIIGIVSYIVMCEITKPMPYIILKSKILSKRNG